MPGRRPLLAGERQQQLVCPLPATPAMPRISPARTAKLMPLSAVPWGAPRRRRLDLQADAPRPAGRAVSFSPPPIIFSAIERAGLARGRRCQPACHRAGSSPRRTAL